MDKNSKNLWDDVSERTQILAIVNYEPKRFHYQLKSLTIDYPIEKDLRKKPCKCNPPYGVIINLFDYPEDTLINLKDLPRNLPNLKSLIIQNINLSSLSGLPSDLPKLEKFGFINTKISNLEAFPRKIPLLKLFWIRDSPLTSLKGLSFEQPFLMRIIIKNTPLESLQFIPRSLPVLKHLVISRTNIRSLKYLPSILPALEDLDLSNNKLVSLKGLPSTLTTLKKFNISGNRFESWASFPNLSTFGGKKYPKTEIHNNPIRTLSGIQENLLRFFVGGEREIGNLKLCPSGMQLVRDWHEIKIKEGLVLKEPTEEFPDYKFVRDPERFDAIQNFYHKTPMELAQQYIKNPDLFTANEIERLGWEGGYQERRLLESNFPSDTLILNEISTRLTHELSSGLALLK